MREAPTVLLVGEHARSAWLVRRALEAEGFRVHAAAQPAQAEDAEQHDLVLLEVDQGGVDLARRVRHQTSRPILMLSSRTDLEHRVAVLEAGADDYLAKPYARQELVARVRALLRGRSLALEHATHRGGPLVYADVELDPATREARRAGRPLKLRHLAFELLAYFLRHPERVIDRRELLEHVWGYPCVGDANVVEVTLSRLRRVLEADGEPRLIHTVRPIGYMLRTRRAQAR